MLILLVVIAIIFGIWLLFKFGLDVLSFIFDIIGALLSAIFSGGNDDSGGGSGGGDSGGGGAEDSW